MTRTVIAGAGIAGLALALGLARRNRDSLVLEAAFEPGETGAGVQIGPNASRALACLGLDAASIPGIVSPAALVVRRGRELSRRPLSTFEDRHGAPYRVAHRGDLWRWLWEAARKSCHVEILTGRRVTAWDGVCATDDKGDAYLARAFIAADGVRSRIGEALVGPTPLREHGLNAWRALVPRERVEAADEVTLALAPPGGHAVAYPVRGGALLNLVLVLPGRAPREAGWNASGDPAVIAELDLPAPLARWAAAAPSWSVWPLRDRAPTPHWGHGPRAPEGPASLIGDAAHPALPFLAQGAAMALEDAAVFSAALDEGWGAPSDALRNAEAERAPRVTRLVKESAAAGRVYHLTGPMALARDTAIRLAPSLTAGRYAWLYDGGPKGDQNR